MGLVSFARQSFFHIKLDEIFDFCVVAQAGDDEVSHEGLIAVIQIAPCGFGLGFEQGIIEGEAVEQYIAQKLQGDLPGGKTWDVFW